MLQKKPLDQNAGGTNQKRRDHQRRPVIDAEILQQQISREGAHHILSAVSEIDDVEHPENDGEPEAEQRIERAVDQAEQELPEQRLRRYAEDLEHAPCPHAAVCPANGPCFVGSANASAADQRTAALLEWPER